jgi:hypothetical protein
MFADGKLISCAAEMKELSLPMTYGSEFGLAAVISASADHFIVHVNVDKQNPWLAGKGNKLSPGFYRLDSLDKNNAMRWGPALNTGKPLRDFLPRKYFLQVGYLLIFRGTPPAREGQ